MANISVSRKSGFIMRSGRMRRETVWLFEPASQITLAAAATAALVTSLNAAALALRPFTVIRSRGSWLVSSDQSAASEFYFGSYGYAVVSDQAVAIGVTAVPTPATDRGSDLFFGYGTWGARCELVGTSWAQNHAPQEFDSRAMRKVNEDSDVVLTMEAGLISSGCIIQFSGRQLIKLH